MTDTSNRSWIDWGISFFKSDPNSEITKLQTEKSVIEADCQKKISDIDSKIQEAKTNSTATAPAQTVSGGNKMVGGKSRRKTKKGKKSTKKRTVKNYMYNIKWNPFK